jgi:WS/DGAT/MGAT family acyltransferase
MSTRASSQIPLSPIDAAWLRMDSASNAMVITTVLRFDAPLAEAAITETITKLLEHRRFRMRVVRQRRSLTGAAWEPDPDFDLTGHVRRVRLPAPGDEAALASFISARMSTPLDRTRPLWQIDIVDGVGHGSALVVRVHHAVGDGVALVRLLLGVSGAPAGHKPAQVGVARAPKPSGVRELAGRTKSQAETLARLLLLPTDASTPLRGTLGVRKLAAFSKPFSLAAIKALAREQGGHVNDLLAAAVAGALRAYLPHPKEVRALVPVFLRGDEGGGGDGFGEEGNHFGLAYLPLPVDRVDRADRVRAVRAGMDAIKSQPDATVAFVVLGAMGLASPRLERFGIELFTKKASMLVTNVPGPSGRVQVAGEDVTSMVVWAPTSGSIGLGFSLLTYAGELRLGVAADANLVPDAGALVACFERELDAMARDAGIASDTAAQA